VGGGVAAEAWDARSHWGYLRSNIDKEARMYIGIGTLLLIIILIIVLL
jgi:hypothetical protein